MCGLVALRSHLIFSSKHNLNRFLWFGMTSGMVLFGINEDLDLQTLFTNGIKTLALDQGWYAWGQDAQVVFIYGLAISSSFIMIMVLWFVREDWRQYWLLTFGLLVITRFVIVRAASFYAVPITELSQFSGGLRINWMLEIIGAVFVVIAASLNLKRFWQSNLRRQQKSHAFAEENFL